MSPDLKLEQSIQQSQKSAGGIIEQTRQIRYVSVGSHEVLTITNAFPQHTKSNLGSPETKLHHELTGNFSRVFNEQIQKVLSIYEG